MKNIFRSACALFLLSSFAFALAPTPDPRSPKPPTVTYVAK